MANLVDRRYRTIREENWIIHPITVSEQTNISNWCAQTLGPSLNYYNPRTDEYGSWFIPVTVQNLSVPMVAFRREVDYTLFLLKWADRV